MICVWCQLHKDSGNAEASEHLSQLQPLEEDVQQARVMIDRRQYEQAVQSLTHAIEVR